MNVNPSGSPSVGANTVASGADALVRLVMIVIATPILIRALGTAQFGAFVFLSMFSAYGILYLLDLGVEGALTTLVARYNAQKEEHKLSSVFKVSLVFYSAMGCVAGAIVWFGSDFITGLFVDTSGALDRGDLGQALKYVSLGLLFEFPAIAFIATLQGIRKFTITKSVNIATVIIQYLSMILVALLYHRVSTLMGAALVVTMAKLAFYLFYGRFTDLLTGPWKFERSAMAALTGFGSTLLLARLIGIVNRNVDRFLTGLVLPVVNLAVYDVVYRPNGLLHLPVLVVGTTTIPETANRIVTSGVEAVGEFFVRLTRYTLLLVIPLAVFVSALAPQLLEVWVGEEFISHSWLISLVAAAVIPAAINGLAYNVAVGLEQPRKIIWIPTVGMLLNVGLSLALIHSLGLKGLLIATLIAQLFMVIPYLNYVSRHAGVRVVSLLQRVIGVLALNIPHALMLLMLSAKRDSLGLWPTLILALCASGLFGLLHFRMFLSSGERGRVLGILVPRLRNQGV